jgi:hypothetical protein
MPATPAVFFSPQLPCHVGLLLQPLSPLQVTPLVTAKVIVCVTVRFAIPTWPVDVTVQPVHGVTPLLSHASGVETPVTVTVPRPSA